MIEAGTKAKRSRLRTWATSLLIAVSLGYLGYVVSGQYRAVLTVIAEMNPWLLGLALLPFTVMYLFKTVYHWLVVRQLGEAGGHVWAVLRAYSQSQVVRYLPGKIWGLVYQASRLQQAVSPQNVVIANFIQLLNTQLYTVWICAAIVSAYFFQQWSWLLLFPFGLLFMAVLHHSTLIERSSAWLASRVTRVKLPQHLSARFRTTVLMISLLTFEWIAFFIGWAFVCNPELSVWSMIVLGACYSVAALLATFAIVVPGGLAVREALFVSVGVRLSFGVEQLLVYGIIARILLTLSEVICMFAIELSQRYIDRVKA